AGFGGRENKSRLRVADAGCHAPGAVFLVVISPPADASMTRIVAVTADTPPLEISTQASTAPWISSDAARKQNQRVFR
ncbi:MAG TPA: hypothetical protein VIT83_03460, partial [Gammaproteobacteria bacterium]